MGRSELSEMAEKYYLDKQGLERLVEFIKQ
jgi:hypothetical protein